MNPNWGSRFTPNSFFPNIKLNDILEIEFQISNALGIPFEYNDMEYYEFVWRYERLVEERKKENESASENQGRKSMSNLGVNMATLNDQPTDK